MGICRSRILRTGGILGVCAGAKETDGVEGGVLMCQGKPSMASVCYVRTELDLGCHVSSFAKLGPSNGRSRKSHGTATRGEICGFIVSLDGSGPQEHRRMGMLLSGRVATGRAFPRSVRHLKSTFPPFSATTVTCAHLLRQPFLHTSRCLLTRPSTTPGPRHSPRCKRT